MGAPAPERGSTRAALLASLALAAATLLVYADVARHGFLTIDDDAYVAENPHVRGGLTWAGLRWACTSADAANWHPLTWLSHMLDCQLFGLDAGAHHLVSAGLHALNAALLFLALRALTGAYWRPLAAAALFALHPLRVESVAWIAERKDVLAGTFWMLCLWAHAGVARRGGLARGLGLAALFALGLAAKPMLVTLPFVLLLLDDWPLGRWRAREGERRARPVLEKLGLFALVGASCALTLWAQDRGGAVNDLAQVPWSVRLENALVATWSYARQTAWPSGLSAFYPHPALLGPDALARLGRAALGAGAALGATSAALLWLGARRPWARVGWLWFLGTLVPVVGLVQVGMQARADRYTYLPSIGLALVAAWGCWELVRRLPRARWAAGGLAVAALVPLALATRARVAQWRTPAALFEDALAVGPESWFAQGNLGLALQRAGEPERALPHLRRAAELRPDRAEPLVNLASALAALGREPQARAALERALRLDPRHAEANHNLGALLARAGRLEEARARFAAAVAAAPEDPRLRASLERAERLLRAGGE